MCDYPGGCDSPKWTEAIRHEVYTDVPNWWEYFNQTDYYNCDAVERNLGDCTWDASWTPKFLQDVKETKFWSMSVWMKPTEASKGMPRFFFTMVRILLDSCCPS